MIGPIFLIGAAVFGVGLVHRVFAAALNRVEQALWGVVIGWSLATTFAYGLARTWGGLGSQATLCAILFVGLAALISWLPTIRRVFLRKKHLQPPTWQRSYTPLTILLCLFSCIYWCLFTTHMLQLKADGGIYSGGGSTFRVLHPTQG